MAMAEQAGRSADKARERGGRLTGAAREQASRVQEQSRGLYQRGKSEAPKAARILAILAAVAVGIGILAVTTIGFVVASPLLILFSPILVPVGVLLLFGTAAAAAAVSVAGWLYQYYKGEHPVGSDRVDQVKQRIVDTAHHLAQQAHEHGSEVNRNLPVPSRNDL